MWARRIAVAGGLGYAPLAPGTVGSLGGVLLFGLAFVALGRLGEALGTGSAPGLAGLALFGVAVLGLLWLGIRASSRAEIEFGRSDDGRIVIDEVVGQLIALSPLLLLFDAEAPNAQARLFLGVVTGFVLFRLFDVWKPGAVRWAERRFEGGWGVMADDVVAGGLGALGLCLVYPFLPDLLLDLVLGDLSAAPGQGASA